jgi:hypothetical protein
VWSKGSWRRLGEGRVVSSEEFRELSGQKSRFDGQADGEVKESLVLFISIAFNPDPTGPVFHKKLFR